MQFFLLISLFGIKSESLHSLKQVLPSQYRVLLINQTIIKILWITVVKSVRNKPNISYRIGTYFWILIWQMKRKKLLLLIASFLIPSANKSRHIEFDTTILDARTLVTGFRCVMYFGLRCCLIYKSAPFKISEIFVINLF